MEIPKIIRVLFSFFLIHLSIYIFIIHHISPFKSLYRWSYRYLCHNFNFSFLFHIFLILFVFSLISFFSIVYFINFKWWELYWHNRWSTFLSSLWLFVSLSFICAELFSINIFYANIWVFYFVYCLEINCFHTTFIFTILI